MFYKVFKIITALKSKKFPIKELDVSQLLPVKKKIRPWKIQKNPTKARVKILANRFGN